MNLIGSSCRGGRDMGEAVIWSLCKVALISALSKTAYGTRSELRCVPSVGMKVGSSAGSGDVDRNLMIFGGGVD